MPKTGRKSYLWKGREGFRGYAQGEEYMDVQAIIDDIDRQFVQMRWVRELFVSIMEGDQPAAKRPGRPKGSADKATDVGTATLKKAAKPARRTMSAEGKAGSPPRRRSVGRCRNRPRNRPRASTRPHRKPPGRRRRKRRMPPLQRINRPVKRPSNGRSKTP